MYIKHLTVICLNVSFCCIAFTCRLRCQKSVSRTGIAKVYGAISSERVPAPQFHNLPRVFVGDVSHNNNDSSLREGSTITLSYDQSFYLTTVMRIFSKGKKIKNPPDNFKLGFADEDDKFNLPRCVRVFDGINGEWLCQILEPSQMDESTRRSPRKMKQINQILQGKCILKLREQNTSQSNTSYPWLFFAPIKKQRAKLLVEKCTEIGVARFTPVMTEHTDPAAAMSFIIENSNSSESKCDDPSAVLYGISDTKRDCLKDIEKLSVVAVEAAEQSEQLMVPEISALDHYEWTFERDVKHLLHYWVLNHECDRVLLICRERTEDRPNVTPLLQALDKCHNQSVAFLIGPEGGWSGLEEELFDEYCSKNPESILGISLGSNILRAETAGITAIAGYSLWQSVSRML